MRNQRVLCLADKNFRLFRFVQHRPLAKARLQRQSLDTEGFACNRRSEALLNLSRTPLQLLAKESADRHAVDAFSRLRAFELLHLLTVLKRETLRLHSGILHAGRVNPLLLLLGVVADQPADLHHLLAARFHLPARLCSLLDTQDGTRAAGADTGQDTKAFSCRDAWHQRPLPNKLPMLLVTGFFEALALLTLVLNASVSLKPA